MILSKTTLNGLGSAQLIVPDQRHFNLPERVLQFGTGVLLRGLPDYFINKANLKGIFNGRIAVVKSTSKGNTNAFTEQDNLYTICVRGIEQGEKIKENIVTSAISRVLTADTDWDHILEIATSKDLRLIVSNTTEVGIQLVKEDINQSPPRSFPAKLLAVLYARYLAFAKTDEDADLVVIATELIPDNGKKLEAIVFELADYQGLDSEFVGWLKQHVHFCNSLVDRIVPGKPDEAVLAELEAELGYTDQLLIMAEPYRLWAIEGGAAVERLLGLTGVDEGIIVKPDIEIYRELKVRLLNGSHTLASAIAFLSGISTVAEAMAEAPLKRYISKVMQKEIAPAIPYEVAIALSTAFADTVIDRFSNPFIAHSWINITFQYTMKIKIRVVPVLLNYYKKYHQVPAHIALGFAAYLVFMRVSRASSNGQYFGVFQGKEYQITDDQGSYFQEKSGLSAAEYIQQVLSDEGLWTTDLSVLPGLQETITDQYQMILSVGMQETLQQALQQSEKHLQSN
ncbi:tagaturonate reductase [Pedobacter gandavensis]|uniref:Tagaturonate reductase n=1 Tax=Pedobacter gandavensis TaxID=2679963 RepID=A0ABR6ER39_9SPHI|nr:tagaturonate reductase [Pedobacter gandavensis]MBB2147708.1 tagaturonate reductase [Pedobacter gandavensis]